eukprot:gene12662-14871_t
MAKLSVNINKIATLRNSRGGNNPDLVKVALDCERFGAEGITVHPRPDERHIRYQDVFDLKAVIATEFNIEGNCREQKFIDLVLANKPAQVTLVPDAQGQLTSNHGWDTLKHRDYLREMVALFKKEGIRVSIFVDPVEEMITAAADTGTDRIELYTEAYATIYTQDKAKAAAPYVKAAKRAQELGLGINAGHDLDLHNLSYFAAQVPALLEVSIGHALISDALYLGLENTVQICKNAAVLDESTAAEVVSAYLKSNPEYESVNVDLGEVKFRSKSDLEDLAKYKILAQKGLIGLNLDHQKKKFLSRDSVYIYQISLTDKAKTFVLKQDERRATVKAMDYVLDEEKPVNLIKTNGRIAKVTVTLKKQLNDFSVFLKNTASKSNFITKTYKLKFKKEEGWTMVGES